MLLGKIVNRRRRTPDGSAPERPKRKPKAAPAAKKTPGFLTSLIEAQDKIPEGKRGDGLHGYIHVSGLLSFCPRRHVLMTMDEVQAHQTPSSFDRLLWAIGRAVERHVRTQTIAALNFAGVYGAWACVCGRHGYAGFHDPESRCGVCGGLATEYREMSLVDDQAKVMGHPDCVILIGDKFHVVEIKSMNKEQFAELDNPIPAHVFQARSYQKILKQDFKKGLLPYDVEDEVIIIYASKAYNFRGKPYKEFHVKPQTAFTTSIMLAWKLAKTAADALKAKKLPPRWSACASMDTLTARNCVACTNCFSRS
jgi:hypothetical protein